MVCLNCLKKIPPEIKYILILFLITRVALTIVGGAAKIVLFNDTLTHFLWTDVWNVWDAKWYLNIAEHGYTYVSPDQGEANYAFFPLYPILIRLVGYLIGSTYAAGIIVSNVCLIIACYFLYKLIRLDEDQETAKRTIKYLFVFPTAFIFSGILTESLFLALILAVFYYARKKHWLLAGTIGLFASLTKLIGAFLILPLAYEYLKQRNFSIKKIRFNALFLLLIPLGVVCFAAYNYHLTGDALAFIHVQKWWGNHTSNPFVTLWNALHSGSFDTFFQGTFTLIALIILIVFIKRIRFSYWLEGIYTLLVPMTGGIMYSMLRHVVIAFPIYLIFAKISKNKNVDQLLTIFLAILQGYLMIIWTTWRHVVI